MDLIYFRVDTQLGGGSAYPNQPMTIWVPNPKLSYTGVRR